jgi:DNA-binding transcriptional MerR regulator
VAERAKQARFLQYRGFTADQIRAALQSQEGDNEGAVCIADPSSESLDQDWPD